MTFELKLKLKYAVCQAVFPYICRRMKNLQNNLKNIWMRETLPQKHYVWWLEFNHSKSIAYQMFYFMIPFPKCDFIFILFHVMHCISFGLYIKIIDCAEYVPGQLILNFLS